jgi:hypothetical protein
MLVTIGKDPLTLAPCQIEQIGLILFIAIVSKQVRCNTFLENSAKRQIQPLLSCTIENKKYLICDSAPQGAK